MTLNKKEMERYSRQMILREIGEEGQIRLSEAKVVIIGCGALGCANSNNLVRAGVGDVRVIDRDIVELNNLHRQLLLDEDDIGRPKAKAAAEKLARINRDVNVESVMDDVNRTNIERFIKDRDLVIDATDNLETRFLINDACVKNDIPWIYGAAIGTYGMSLNILPGRGPCLSCIAPELPNKGAMETCDTSGIMNTTPVMVATMQSTEALKILTGNEPNTTLLVLDVWNNEFQSMTLQRDDGCSCCALGQYKHLESGPQEIISSLCGTNTMQIVPVKPVKIRLDELAVKLEKVGDVMISEEYVRFTVEDYRLDIFGNGRVIIHGTEDQKVARSLMAKYVGV